MSGIICCSCLTFRHFSSTVCSAAMAKRIRQESAEERVTAKSRPVMNLIARTLSVVSSSTSSNPVKTWYGYQDPERHVLDDRTEQPVETSDQTIYKRNMVVLGLLKSAKVRLRHTIDQGNLIKLLGVWYNKFVLITEKLISTEMRIP